MRIVFIGATSLAELTARMLQELGHEVIIIESDRTRLEDMAEELDCGLIHGDGTRPAILREAAPERTDVLFCLTSNDQANIIASLVGRSLGFSKVVTKVTDEEFEHIAIELGLEHLIIPNRTIGRYLVDTLSGQDALEISAMIKGDARLFSFVARSQDQGKVEELHLPGDSRIICLYRRGEFMPARRSTTVKTDDEVVVLTHSRHLEELRKHWSGNERGGSDAIKAV